MEMIGGKKDLRWSLAWRDPSFKKKLISGLTLTLIALACLPFFFQHIELREGAVLNDFVLEQLNPRDVSIPIFTMLWSMAILFAIRSVQNPTVFVTFLHGFWI